MRTDPGYTRRMRVILVVAVGLLLVGAGACGTEKSRPKDDDGNFSAAQLGGRYKPDDPIVQMLSPEQRQALRDADMMQEPDPDATDELGDDQAAADGEEESTTGEKVAGSMMSLLAVGISLGVMVAPYLLF